MDILQTTNPTCGFHGAFSHHDTDPSVAWPLASEAIAKATGCQAKRIKTFLDSSQGRLFAKGVIEDMSKNPLETVETAVDFAVASWMHRKIDRNDASVYGIPVGVPYLKGFVCHCELRADTGKDWPPLTNSFV
jgi:hypothetical protein